jgi:hypothetical protein
VIGSGRAGVYVCESVRELAGIKKDEEDRTRKGRGIQREKMSGEGVIKGWFSTLLIAEPQHLVHSLRKSMSTFIACVLQVVVCKEGIQQAVQRCKSS